MNNLPKLPGDAILFLYEGFEADLSDPHAPTLRYSQGEHPKEWHLYHVPPHLDAAAAHQILAQAPTPGVAWTYSSSKRGRALLRGAGRAYATSEGNVFLTDESRLIWLELTSAPPQLRHVDTVEKRWSKADLRVLFVLLALPEALTATQPQLAEWAGVSQASAHRTLKMLLATHNDYTDRARWAMRRPQLLERWVEAYATDLRPRLLIATYAGRYDTTAIPTPPSGFVLSGAAAMVARQQVLAQAPTLELYGPTDDPAVRTQYRLAKSAVGNVILRKRFWTFDPMGLAPELIVYADLLATGDTRDRKAAETLRPNL